MPLWVAALIGGLIAVAGTLVGKVLVSLGFGYLVFTGIDLGLQAAKAAVLQNVSGLPADAIALMGIAKVGVCINILTSAIASRLLLSGMQSGTVRRLAQIASAP